MATIVAVFSKYQADSQNKISFTGFVDSILTPLTNANGSAKITLTNSVTGVVLVNAAAMTYSGTPGQWDYTGLAAVFPDFTTLTAVLAGYDNTGASLYVSLDITLTPNEPASGKYSRNSVNTFALPAFNAPGGAVLDNTNSLGKVSVAAAGTGAVILAATNMVYQAGPPKQWVYSAAASLFGAGQRLIVTCQGYDQTGTTLYGSCKTLLTDGG